MNDNDFNKQEDTDKKSKAKVGFSNFLKKTSEGIQKGAKNVSEFTQKTIHDQKMKHYNPLFKEELKSKTFKLPSVIQIVSEVSRRDVDVCEGAVGWTSTVNDVDILHVYEEYTKLCKVQFVPFEKVDAIYCADNFDKSKYINSDAIFERAMNEKLTELENIAYCLGATSCSIELIESDGQAESSRIKIGAKKQEIWIALFQRLPLTSKVEKIYLRFRDITTLPDLNSSGSNMMKISMRLLIERLLTVAL